MKVSLTGDVAFYTGTVSCVSNICSDIVTDHLNNSKLKKTRVLSYAEGVFLQVWCVL